MAGPNPLNPSVLKDWSELVDIAPLHPIEVQAVLAVHDAMILTDDEPSKKDDGKLPQESRRIQRKWPQRKRS